jgi:hypothetical protein
MDCGVDAAGAAIAVAIVYQGQRWFGGLGAKMQKQDPAARRDGVLCEGRGMFVKKRWERCQSADPSRWKLLFTIETSEDLTRNPLMSFEHEIGAQSQARIIGPEKGTLD